MRSTQYRIAATAVPACLVALSMVAPGRLSAQIAEERFADLSDRVRAAMAEDEIPGAVVVVMDSGRVVFQQGYGLADLATGRPVDAEDTLFRLGSISKVLTSLALNEVLLARGLDPGTRVGDLVSLPRMGATGFEPVRIHHLLSHTGGFDQTGLGRHAPAPDARPSLGVMLEDHLVPIRPPGRVATYDTYGMTLAGLVIESLAGVSYADHMRSALFEPLGMNSSFIEAPAGDRDRLAVGYGLTDGTHVAQPYEWYTTLPASSADATGADVGRLMVALLGGDPALAGDALARQLDESLGPDPTTRTAPPYWNGWWVDVERGRLVLQHGGVMRGYSSQLVLLPHLRAGLFVAYNRDPETGPPPRLRARLTREFLDRILTDSPDPGPGSPTANGASMTDGSALPGELEGWWVATLGCFSCAEGNGWPLRVEHLAADGPSAIVFLGASWEALDTVTYRNVETGTLIRFARDGEDRLRFANAGWDGFERLDEDLLARVERRLGPNRTAGALQALWSRVEQANSRQDELAELAERAAEVAVSGIYLLHPVGVEGLEPMRVELYETGKGYTGWARARPDGPNRSVARVVAGGDEVWIVVEVPGGELDIRLRVDGQTVSGTIAEGLELMEVTGEHRPGNPRPLPER